MGAKEEPVAGVAHEREYPAVERAQAGDVLDKPPVAVAEEAERVQDYDRNAGALLAQAAQEQIGEPQAEYCSGQVPEMVKRALEKRLTRELKEIPALQVPGVDVDGQIERRARGVDYEQLFKASAHIHAAEDEIAGRHEEKRHGHARDDAG